MPHQPYQKGTFQTRNVPSSLLQVLNRDLKVAGIPKRDERGRTIDVHALRTTFGTHLSKGGVPLRTAQAAMRHSDPALTANVYTDPKLLDVAGALNVLPTLPLKDNGMMDHQKGTGTHGRVDSSPQGTGSSLVPVLVPTRDNSCIYRSTGDKTPSAHHTDQGQTRTHVSTDVVKRKTPLTRTVNGIRKSGREDLNLRPPDPQSGALTKLRYAP